MTMSQELGIFSPDNLIAGGFPLSTSPALLATGDLKRGAVLGKVLYSVSSVLTASASANGTLTNLRLGKDFKYGVYLATCIEAPLATVHEGVFRITDPDGIDLGVLRLSVGAGGSAGFSNSQISFTITDGTTNFAATDVFTITVTEGVPNTASVSGGTGNGTMLQLEGRPDTKIGSYVVQMVEVITNGGKFSVTDPDGVLVGYAYASKLVLASGSANGTITEIKAGPKFKSNGPYLIECTTEVANGGTFTVTDPDGVVIGTVTITPGAGASAIFWHEQLSFKITDGSSDFHDGDTFTLYWFENSHLGFVIWDGSTDFILANYFTVTVTNPSQSAVKLVNSDNNDGSQWPSQILAEDIDATDAAVECATYDSGQFNESELYFGGNDTIETHRLAMNKIGLKTARAQEYY
jgi:hypothetical protein